MRFKLQTDYALRALVYLAAKDGNCTTDEIAEYYEISSAHLGRVIRRLQKYGYVKAIRGRRGGVRLDREASAIVLGDVVNTLEEHAQPLDPPTGEEATVVDEASRLKAVLRRGHGLFIEYLENVTLADLAEDGLPSKEELLAKRAEEQGHTETSEAPTTEEQDAPATPGSPRPLDEVQTR